MAVKEGDTRAALIANLTHDWPVVSEGKQAIKHRVGGRAAGTIGGYWVLTRSTFGGTDDARMEAAVGFPLCDGNTAYAQLRPPAPLGRLGRWDHRLRRVRHQRQGPDRLERREGNAVDPRHQPRRESPRHACDRPPPRGRDRREGDRLRESSRRRPGRAARAQVGRRVDGGRKRANPSRLGRTRSRHAAQARIASPPPAARATASPFARPCRAGEAPGLLHRRCCSH